MMFVSCLLTDLEVLHFFNGSDNLFIDQLALVLTSGLTWIPLYLTLFYIIVRNNETMAQIGLAVMGALVCVALSEGITDGVVKPLVERWRPNNDPILKYSIQVVGNLRGSGYSFFSAHAANTMSIAMFFSLLMRASASPSPFSRGRCSTAGHACISACTIPPTFSADSSWVLSSVSCAT